jgi:phage shock protein C
MADTNRNTFDRPDTFLGICEAMGQDFGFNPLWLRLAFVPALFFFPFQAPFAYLGLGLVVLASRLIFPAKTVAAPISAATLVAAKPETVAAPAREAEPEAQMLLAA